MSTLITGCAGGIGLTLTQKLLEKGEKVIGVDSFITGSESNMHSVFAHPNFTLISMRIEEAELTETLKDETLKIIYHLACPTGVENLSLIPEEMITSLTLGTMNILRIATDHKCPILLASSSEVYGDPQEHPQKESYPGHVLTTSVRAPYQEGKRMTETIGAMFYRKYGTQVKIARIFNCYGPNYSEKDIRVVPKFIKLALNNEPLPIHRDGETRRAFIFIDDLLEGFKAILEKGEMAEPYNVGCPDAVPIEALAKLIIQLTGSKSQIISAPPPEDEPRFRVPDVDKLKGLGWSMQWTLAEGLEKTIAFFKEYISQRDS